MRPLSSLTQNSFQPAGDQGGAGQAVLLRVGVGAAQEVGLYRHRGGLGPEPFAGS